MENIYYVLLIELPIAHCALCYEGRWVRSNLTIYNCNSTEMSLNLHIQQCSIQMRLTLAWGWFLGLATWLPRSPFIWTCHRCSAQHLCLTVTSRQGLELSNCGRGKSLWPHSCHSEPRVQFGAAIDWVPFSHVIARDCGGMGRSNNMNILENCALLADLISQAMSY